MHVTQRGGPAAATADDGGARYTGLARALHWITAVLVVTIATIGFYLVFVEQKVDVPSSERVPKEIQGKLGQTREACLTLGEVGNRYPGSDVLAQVSESARTVDLTFAQSEPQPGRDELLNLQRQQPAGGRFRQLAALLDEAGEQVVAHGRAGRW